MAIVSGKLKPRPSDSAFGFLQAGDGTDDVYVKLSTITDKTFGDLFGCTLTVETVAGERGPVAIRLLYVEGTPLPTPPKNTNGKSANSQTSRPPAPGQYLSKWANINLVDHTQSIARDDGSVFEKRYLSCLPELHDMLLEGEEWDFQSERESGNLRILENYLRFMFYRLYKEEKILYSRDNSIAIFDTGLVDNLFEPIYGVFQANKPESRRPFRFEGWCRAGRGALGKKILTPFSRLPDRAEFFSNINDVILPRDIEVIEQWEHIIDDGVRRGRYPSRFLKRYIDDNLKFDEDLADGIGVSLDVRLEYLNSVMDHIADSRNYLEFKHKIESCIKTALKRVEWNYKTAIPIYHPRRDKMSIALPLALFDSENADLALILEKKNARNYYASTVLTLDQAYLSARLVCRPLSDWLTTNIGVTKLDMDD